MKSSRTAAIQPWHGHAARGPRGPNRFAMKMSNFEFSISNVEVKKMLCIPWHGCPAPGSRNPGIRRGIAAILSPLFLALVFAGCSGTRQGKDTQDQARPKPNDSIAVPPEPETPIDNRPPEIIRSKRKESRDPQVDFEFLLGWEAEYDDGGRVAFERSREEQLWGEYAAKIEYLFDSAGSEFTFRPPRPIAIRDRFDCVNIWVHGQHAAGDENAPGCEVNVIVRDAGNKEHVLEMGAVRGTGWSLMHRRFSGEISGRISYPCSFTELRFLNCPASIAVTNYLDSLSFYFETFPPLKIRNRPSRNLELQPGQPAGLHTARKRLDFPSRPQTIVPGAGSPDVFNNQLNEVSDGVFEFSYRGPDGHLSYLVDSGNLGAGVRVRWDGQDLGRFLVGAKLLGIENPNRTITVLRREDNTLYVEYQGSGTRRFEIIGRSLVGQISAAGGLASGVDLGSYEGGWSWNHIRVPGLPETLGGLLSVGWLGQGSGTNESPCFVACSFDWYRSSASYFEPTGGDSGEPGFGRAIYAAGTDGRTADLFERVVLTVSPRVEDVLPAIANPRGDHVETITARVWVDSQSTGPITNELSTLARLVSLGVTNAIQANFVVGRDGRYESTDQSANASSGIGDPQAFADLMKSQDRAGWTRVTADNVMHANPIGEAWSENTLLRGTAWEWREGMTSHFLVKPPIAVEINENLNRRKKWELRVGGSYVEELCAVPPWNYTDYDSRVPGAASFGQAYYCVGEVLRNNSKMVGGPVIGRGGCEALYAGLMDGYLPRDSTEPYLPVFCLTRLQSLCCRIGAGDFHPTNPVSNDALDRYLAAQIVYGSSGRIRPAVMTDRQIFRAGAIAEFMQPIYTLKAPGRIAYWDGINYVSTSEAITAGSLNRSQLYMIFDDSFEVWVNGNESLSWDVRVGSDLWTLPPYGWVAVGPDSLCVSAMVEERRMDFMENSRFTWIDGRNGEGKFRGIACSRGALRIQRRELDKGEQLDLMHVGQAETIGIPVERGLSEDSVFVSRIGIADEDETVRYNLEDRTLSIDVPKNISRFQVLIHKP